MLSVYPEDSPVNNEKWRIQEVKSLIVIALSSIAHNIGDVNVMCRAKPKKGAIALEDFRVGELVLVPVTSGVNIEKVGTPAAKSPMACVVSKPPKDTVIVLQSQFDIPCPMWFVQPHDDDKKVNMKVEMRSFVSLTNFPTSPRAKIAGSSSVEIPVYVNTRAIKAGDELLYYKPQTTTSSIKRTFLDIGEIIKL